MAFKPTEILLKLFKSGILLYFIIATYYFIQKSSGGGDELLFINNLQLINNQGWLVAIKKGISIPYMLLAYPFSFIFDNYIALRLVNLLLLGVLFLYFSIKRNKSDRIFYYYLLFFISTVGYFFFGTNDTLFFIGVIVFINEVYLLQKNETWNSNIAFFGLIISLFTRELIVVYSPVLLLCFCIIYKNNGFKKMSLKQPLILLLFFLILNISSLIENSKISYDQKLPPQKTNATWTQRQYLAQLMVNSGELKNFNHPSWKQTDTYLTKNGESSLPRGIIEGLFFDFKLTVKEFFKDLFYCFLFGFRQLGLILFVPLFFLFKYVFKTKKLSLKMLIPISLYMMIAIFSLIIISFVELRWLAPFFIMSIVYFSDIQKKGMIHKMILELNYIILILFSLYGIFRIIEKF